jgi:DNA-binding PadR family transcriptional regulator
MTREQLIKEMDGNPSHIRAALKKLEREGYILFMTDPTAPCRRVYRLTNMDERTTHNWETDSSRGCGYGYIVGLEKGQHAWDCDDPERALN